MIIDNEGKKSKTGLYIALGVIAAAGLMIGGFFMFFSNLNKDTDMTSNEREQIKAIATNYFPGEKGVATMTNKEFDNLVDETNKKVEKNDNKFATRISGMSVQDIIKYYRDNTQTNTVPDYIKDEIDDNKIVDPGSEDKPAEDNKPIIDLKTQIKLIIQINGEDYKKRIAETALKVEEKIVDQNAYNNCKKHMGGGESVNESDLSSSASEGSRNESNPLNCGVQTTESSYLGDKYSANILGGIVYGYKKNTLDQVTGLDEMTFRQLSKRASYWLENTEYPEPYHYEYYYESSFYNNAIVTGLWETIDFKNIDSYVIKEDNTSVGDGFYKVVYKVAFRSNKTWYEAQIVEADQYLRLFDIKLV